MRAKVRSHALVSSSTSGQCVLNGCGPVRGGRISSYRADVVGFLASVRIIHYIMASYTMMQVPFRGQIARDNKALVQQVQPFFPSSLRDDPRSSRSSILHLHPMAPEWDVRCEIYHTTRHTWTHTTLEHINGHQDKDKADTDLPLLAQLNVVADQLAGTAHQQSCPDPSPRAHLMSHTGVQLHLSTGIVTSQYDQTIRRAYTNPLSISYRQVRYQWPPEVFETIHWGAHHAIALRRQRASHLSCVHCTKVVLYDLLPTNKLPAPKIQRQPYVAMPVLRSSRGET